MNREFTATCHIAYQGKFLLLFHPKHQKWLPPGGHLEKDETPPECARREVREETGLEIAFLAQENVLIQEDHAHSLERPFLMLLESIPQYKDIPPHQHIDLIYVAEPVGGILTDGKWFSPEEVCALSPDEVFPDVQKTIRQIVVQLSLLEKDKQPLSLG